LKIWRILRRLWGTLRYRIGAVLFWCEAWCFTRPRRALLLSLPAVLVSAGVIAVPIVQSTRSEEVLAATYREAAEDALKRRDMGAAEVYVPKLVQLDPTSSETRFAMARWVEQKGDHVRAQQLLAELAPDDASGYPAALFGRAQQMLRQTRTFDRAARESLVHHLRESLKWSEGRETASMLLADICAAQQQFREAAAHLEPLVSRRPELHLKLAKLYATMGDQTRARHEIREAAGCFREHLDQDASDVRARLLLAQSQAMLGDFASAESGLLECLREVEGGGDLRSAVAAGSGDPRRTVEEVACGEAGVVCRALSQLYVAMYDQHRQSDQKEIGVQLDLLQKSLRFGPNDPETLTRLAALAVNSEQDSSLARDLLQDALARGQTPATVHLILGTHAAVNSRWKEARLHLEQAQRMNARTPALLNNLAWVLAHDEPADLGQAVRLADAAVELAPDHPEIRQTRGTILVRLERWEEAVTDLELAIGKLTDRPHLHELLAQAYSHLGDDDLAGKHRQLAQRSKNGDDVVAPTSGLTGP
jgi:tetratricopeptide (TPR) repeat protein